MVSNPELDRGIISFNDGQWSSGNYPLSVMRIVFSSKEHNQGAKRWVGTRSWSIVTIEWNCWGGKRKTMNDARGRHEVFAK